MKINHQFSRIAVHGTGELKIVSVHESKTLRDIFYHQTLGFFPPLCNALECKKFGTILASRKIAPPNYEREAKNTGARKSTLPRNNSHVLRHSPVS